MGKTHYLRAHTGKATLFLFVFLLFVLTTTVSAGAATIYVSPSGNDTFGDGTFSNPYESLTKGISAAAAYDVIQLDYGIFSVATTGDSFPIFMKDNVTVRGMGFSGTTVMGDGMNVVLLTYANTGIAIEDITVTGGGMGGVAFNNVTGRISRSRITGNTGGYGGGIGIGLGSPNVRVENCIIDNNTAAMAGGGITVAMDSLAQIVNCTVYGNTIPLTGMNAPGIANFSPTAVIMNNLIWNNRIGDLIFGTPTEEYWCPAVPNNAPTYNIVQNYDFMAYGGLGNSAADPLLVDPGAGNFHVQKTPIASPAIDNGTSAYYANSTYYYVPDVDIDGTPRPIDMGFPSYDIGAYEENNDSVAPTGSISVNSGDPSTTSADVTLNQDAIDTGGSGLYRMRFSNDGLVWSPWYAYATAWPYWNLNDLRYGGIDSNGLKTVFAQFIDHAGNPSETVSDTIALNPHPPTGTVGMTTGVPGYSATEEVTLTLTAVDSSGYGLGSMDMAFSNSGLDGEWSNWEDYSVTRLGWNLVSGTGGVAGEGPKTVYVKFKDGSGIESVAPQASASIILDTTKPVDSSVAIAGSPTYVLSPTVSLTVSAVDADSYGVAKMQFSNNGTTWSDWYDYSSSYANWDLTATAFGGSADNGTKTVFARFRDPAGNVSDSSPAASVIYDGADPTGTIAIHGSPLLTTNRLVDLDLSCSTAIPGLTRMRFSNDSESWSDVEVFQASKTGWDLIGGRGGTPGDGVKTVYVRYIDVAGRESSLLSASVTLDETAPTGTLSINSGAEYTTSSTVTLNLTASDNGGSGLAEMRFSNDGVFDTEPWELNTSTTPTRTGWALTAGNGTKTVYAQFKDNVGNISTGTISDTIILDAAPPAAFDLSSPTDAAWTVASPTLTWSASSDEVSGLAKYQLFIDGNLNRDNISAVAVSTTPAAPLTEGAHTWYMNAVDMAGNVTQSTSTRTINVDATAPTGTIIIEGKPFTGSRIVTLDLSAADLGGSALYQMRFSNNNSTWSDWETMDAPSKTRPGWDLASFSGTSNNGTKTVYAQFRDTAGNISISTISDNIVLAMNAASATWTTQDDFERNASTTGAAVYRAAIDTLTLPGSVGLARQQDYSNLIAAGYYHNVGRQTNGMVVAVGSNTNGKLDVGSWAGITAIAAGYQHTVGVKSDGTSVAVGDNTYHQLDVSSWTNIAAVAAGENHTVGLRNDHTVVTVGNNDNGQCVVSDWPHNISKVSAGKFHTIGLTDTGTVVATGRTAESQCAVHDWTNIIDIAAAGYFSVGLKSDGTVVAVGANSYGQMNVSSWTGVTAIAAGYCNTVGLKGDGTVVVAGDNTYGQLGASSWTGIVAVEAGAYHIVGVKADGTVVSTAGNVAGLVNVSSWTDIRPFYMSPGFLGGTGSDAGLSVYSGNVLLGYLPLSLTSSTSALLPGQAVKFAIKTSLDGSNWSGLMGRDGQPIDWATGTGNYLGQAGTDILSFSIISGIAPAPYIQVIARLESDGFSTPILNDATLTYAGDSLGSGPVGTIKINGNAEYAASTTVNLDLFAAGNGFGMDKMRFSNDPLAAIDPSGAAWGNWEDYGLSWSGWDLAAYGGTSAEGIKTVYAQFKDLAGNVSTETASDSIFLDTAVPSDPDVTSPSHTPSVWSDDNTVDISWSGATDSGSGVAGVSYEWSQSDSTEPDTVLDAAGSSGSTTSAALIPDAQNWYFHLRTEDRSGKWTSTVHFGPFFIDIANPSGGDISINGGAASTRRTTVRLSLSPSDAGSGVEYTQLSNDPLAATDPSHALWSDWQPYETDIPSWDLTAYGGSPDIGSKTVYVRFKDRAGNISDIVNRAISLTNVGTSDIGLYRTGLYPNWLVKFSTGSDLNGATTSVSWGNAGGDTPLVGDFDGNGYDDLGIYRNNTYPNWFFLPALLDGGGFVNPGIPSNTRSLSWGNAGGDTPLVGDFNGDGQMDIAIYRTRIYPNWYFLMADNTTPNGFKPTSETKALSWGNAGGDTPLVGDFNGDGCDDIAIYRTGSYPNWYFLYADPAETTGFRPAGETKALSWGNAGGDKPIVGNFNGDKSSPNDKPIDDIGIHRTVSFPNWYFLAADPLQPNGFSSSGSAWSLTWGNLMGDEPIIGDFSGDGTTDIGIKRVSYPNWFILAADKNDPTHFTPLISAWQLSWGNLSGDKALVGSFD